MEELDLKKLINIFWNKRLHIMVITLIAIIIGFIYSFYFVTPKYQSYTTLVLVKATENTENSTKTITSSDVGLAKSLIGTYSQLAKSKTILRPTINNLQLNETEDTLMKKITVTEINDTEMLKITVKDENPVKAMKIANELTKVFSEKVSEMYVDNVYILDEAEESITPCNINHPKDLIIFFAIGLVISAVYVLIANMFDTTIKDSEDIESNTELTTLVSIPFVNDDINRGGIY